MGKRIYAGNLSEQTDENSLKQAFSAQGTVEMVRLMTDKGVSRKFAFVEMSSEREAMNAINSLNGTELDGSTIVVNEATTPGSKRGAGGFNSFNSRPAGRRPARF